MPIDPSIVTRQHCDEWTKTPEKNPISKHKIKLNGPTYNQLKDICMQKFNVGLMPTVQQPNARNAGNVKNVKNANNVNNVPSVANGNDSKNYNTSFQQRIRACPNITYKSPLVDVVTPRRRRIHANIVPVQLAKMQGLYQQLGICEAPPHVNLHYTQGMAAIGKGLYVGIIQLLHLMYGPCVHHTMFTLQYAWDNKMHLTHEISDINLWNTGVDRIDKDNDDDFKALVDQVKSTSQPRCVAIGVRKQGKPVGHAIMLVLYKNGKAGKQDESVNMAVVDPNMNSAEWEFFDMINAFFSQKPWGIKVYGSSVHDSGYQDANATNPVSSMDPEGYCALWVCLLMDMFGTKATSGHSIKSLSDVKDAIALPTQISTTYTHLWRKLIIDYAVSRLLSVHMAAHELSKVPKAKKSRDTIQSSFVGKYIEKLSIAGIKNELLEYLGRHNGPLFLERLQGMT